MNSEPKGLPKYLSLLKDAHNLSIISSYSPDELKEVIKSLQIQAKVRKAYKK